MVGELSRLEFGQSRLLTDRAIALSEQFEVGVKSVYLPSAQLRVSASVPYSDTYTLDEITFWLDRSLDPGRTTMPFPEYLLEIWKKCPGPEVKLQDFRSNDETRLFSVSCSCRSQNETLVEYLGISDVTAIAYSAKLDGLAAEINEVSKDLLVAGIIAILRLKRWECRALENDADARRICFVEGSESSGSTISPEILLATKDIFR